MKIDREKFGEFVQVPYNLVLNIGYIPAIILAECIFYADDEDGTIFLAWRELNRKIGIPKTTFYRNIDTLIKCQYLIPMGINFRHSETFKINFNKIYSNITVVPKRDCSPETELQSPETELQSPETELQSPETELNIQYNIQDKKQERNDVVDVVENGKKFSSDDEVSNLKSELPKSLEEKQTGLTAKGEASNIQIVNVVPPPPKPRNELDEFIDYVQETDEEFSDLCTRVQYNAVSKDAVKEMYEYYIQTIKTRDKGLCMLENDTVKAQKEAMRIFRKIIAYFVKNRLDREVMKKYINHLAWNGIKENKRVQLTTYAKKGVIDYWITTVHSKPEDGIADLTKAKKLMGNEKEAQREYLWLKQSTLSGKVNKTKFLEEVTTINRKYGTCIDPSYRDLKTCKDQS